MKDFKKAHSNMLFGQFLPNKLTDKKLINAFSQVWCEDFMPQGLISLSYSDQGMKLDDIRTTLPSLSLMMLLQEASITKKDVVLDVGGGTGYGAIIMSYLAKSVDCFEEDNALHKKMCKTIKKRAPRNLSCDPFPKTLYNVIIIEGSLCDAPFIFLEKLKDGGRLFVFETLSNVSGNLCRAVKYHRTGKTYTKSCLFEAVAPSLDQHEGKESFVF